MTLIALTKRAARAAAPACLAVLGAGASRRARGGVDRDRRQQGQHPAFADRHSRARRQRRRCPGRRRYRRRRRVRSPALRPLPAARSEDVHRDDFLRQPAAELRRLEGARGPGAGDRRRVARGQRAAPRRLSPVGRVRRSAHGRPAVLAPPERWRQVAHKIADSIYQRLTGEKGYFNTPHRVRRRNRPQDRAHQAPGDHGSGWRQRALPHARQRHRADAAVQSVGAGDHLHVDPGAAAGKPQTDSSRASI